MVVEEPRASRKVTVWSFVPVLILLGVCVVWLGVTIQSAAVFLCSVLFLFLASIGSRMWRESWPEGFGTRMLRDPRSALVQVWFGQSVVSLSATRLSAGDHFELAYQQKWKRFAEVDRVLVQLVLRETVQYTSVSDSDDHGDTCTDRHDKVVQRHVTPGRRFQKGEICGGKHAFRVPPDGMHTFAPTSNNRIEWYVMLAVEVPKWPGGLSFESEITVLPELRRLPPDQTVEQTRFRALEAEIRPIRDALAGWIKSNPAVASAVQRIQATADVEVRLILQGGETDGGVRCYEPGSTVRGMVQLVTGQDVKCDRVFVAIGWHTEGRGDRDAATVDQVDVARGPLKTNMSSTHSFVLTLPGQPWSYAGHYINIVWEVTATMAIPFTRDIKRTEPIVVVPRRLA